MQGLKRGEVRLGHLQDNGEESATVKDNQPLRMIGERVDYLINIGSTTIRVGSVESNLVGVPSGGLAPTSDDAVCP